MACAHVRIHAELEDLLPRKRRGEQPLSVSFDDRPAIKDLIEAVGIPHPEVDVILLEGSAALFEARVEDGGVIDVFPSGRGPPLAPAWRLVPPLERDRRFVLDGHLAKLAALLRMLGFDATGGIDCEDAQLARLSAEEDRILLTRDLGLLKRSIIRRGAFVRAVDPKEQGREIVRRFDLAALAHPFTRCLGCNSPLVPVEKADVLDQLPPRVRERQEVFFRCPTCGKIYWSGTHRERMEASIERLLGFNAATPSGSWDG